MSRAQPHFPAREAACGNCLWPLHTENHMKKRMGWREGDSDRGGQEQDAPGETHKPGKGVG